MQKYAKTFTPTTQRVLSKIVGELITLNNPNLLISHFSTLEIFDKIAAVKVLY